MVKIRLKRVGRKGQPSYRIVVMESSKPRDGKVIEDLGFYNPRNKPSSFEVDVEKAKAWIAKGAQPSDTVKGHLVKAGVLKSDRKHTDKQKPKKKEAASA